MNKCMIILNPSSGKEKALAYEKLIIEQLSEYETIVYQTEGEGDATKFARQACDERFDIVVIVGGDGTLNECINGIAEQPHRPIVGIVPLGTVNDFARALNIPLEPEEAIKLLGKATRKADIGKVNEVYFTNIVAIGEIATAVGDVSVEQKTQLGPLAYLLQGTKAAVMNDSFHLTVKANGQQYVGETLLFLCVLTNSVGSFEKINEAADVADGLLHIFLLKSVDVLQVVGMAKNLLTGNMEQDERIVKVETSHVTVEADDTLQLNVDGDNIGVLPAHISILTQHITVYSPA